MAFSHQRIPFIGFCNSPFQLPPPPDTHVGTHAFGAWQLSLHYGDVVMVGFSEKGELCRLNVSNVKANVF